jgi:hypothetical protein
MAALRVSAMDMLRRRVSVQQAVAEVKGELVWSTPKSYERRSVPFPRFLADELGLLMVGKKRDDLLITARKGGVLESTRPTPPVAWWPAYSPAWPNWN